MSKQECSLKSINDEPCHRMVREGICPGFTKGFCVNTSAIETLTTRGYLKSKTEFPVRIYFYSDSSEEAMKKALELNEITQRNISLLMRRVKRKNNRKQKA